MLARTYDNMQLLKQKKIVKLYFNLRDAIVQQTTLLCHRSIEMIGILIQQQHKLVSNIYSHAFHYFTEEQIETGLFFSVR